MRLKRKKMKGRNCLPNIEDQWQDPGFRWGFPSDSKSSPSRQFFAPLIFTLIVTVTSHSLPILPAVLQDQSLIDCARKSKTICYSLCSYTYRWDKYILDTFISPIVWNMCENLPYASVYFIELHNEQECYWPTIYRAGAAVVSTITSFKLCSGRTSVSRE